jgi:putative ABC transport system substrate-binding protein
MITIARRKLLAALVGAASWPIAARAQQVAMPVIGFLNRGTPEGYAKNVAAFYQGKTAADSLGLQIHVLHASSVDDFEPAFEAALRLRCSGLVIGADTLFNTWIERLATMAGRNAMPTIYQYREFAAAGALMSYGGSIIDQYRLAGTYTGRILKGEKPADLPVQQATKIELIINLKTAKTLGLTIPPDVLSIANEVIE